MTAIPLVFVLRLDEKNWEMVSDHKSLTFSTDWQAMVEGVKLCKHKESVLIVEREKKEPMAWEFVQHRNSSSNTEETVYLPFELKPRAMFP